jgi:hypothetical protein
MAERLQLEIGCHAYIEGVDTSYGYVPTLGAGIAYCTLFGLSMIVHTVQMTWKRTWWTSVFSIGCLGKYISLSLSPVTPNPNFVNKTLTTTTVEVIGWAGRTWSSKCPYNSTAFLMQISTLIIGKPYSTLSKIQTPSNNPKPQHSIQQESTSS